MQNTTTNDDEYVCYVGLEKTSRRQVNGANKSRSYTSKQQAIKRQSKKNRVKTDKESDSVTTSDSEPEPVHKQRQSPKQKKGIKKPNLFVSVRDVNNEVYDDAQVEYDVQDEFVLEALYEYFREEAYKKQILDDCMRYNAYMSHKAELEYRNSDTTEPVDHYRNSLLLELIKEYDDHISTCRNVEMQDPPDNDLLHDPDYLAIRDEMLDMLRSEHLRELEIMYSIVTHCNGIRFGSNDLVV
jgi:hypothetical protein